MSDKNDSPAQQASRGRPLRFGLKSLLIFGLVFCLLFGFVGRNLVRIRREDAAIESLKQAGATIYIATGDGWDYHPATHCFSEDSSWELVPSFTSRLIGWSGDASVVRVEITSDASDADRLRKALASLAAFPELESLGLAGPLVDDASLKALSSLPELSSLALARTSVTPQGLAGIASPQRIRVFSFYGARWSADALSGVGSLEGIMWLNVAHTSPSVDELNAIASLPNLQTLQFRDAALSGYDLHVLVTGAERLRNLSLIASDVDDEEIGTVASLDSLESLAVDDISDDGLAKLASLSRLRWLEVAPPVTEEAALAFAAERPDCILKYRTPDLPARYYRGGEELDPDVAENIYAALTGVPDDDE